MLKDANDANKANNMHSSYTRWVLTALMINYQRLCRSVCISVTCTMLAPEQLNAELFRFSTC